MLANFFEIPLTPPTKSPKNPIFVVDPSFWPFFTKIAVDIPALSQLDTPKITPSRGPQISPNFPNFIPKSPPPYARGFFHPKNNSKFLNFNVKHTKLRKFRTLSLLAPAQRNH